MIIKKYFQMICQKKIKTTKFKNKNDDKIEQISVY